MPPARTRAPELTGGVGWLNTSHPLQLKDLQGKVVILDFWTFCCINCMHVIPDLKRLEAKYPNDLVVIGVHSAKFDNERDTKNIRSAILRYGIKHPVLNDANFAVWRAYGISSWPTLVVIAPDGQLVGQVSGEGNFDILDHTVAKLIHEFRQLNQLNSHPLKLSLEQGYEDKSLLSFPGKITSDSETGRLFVSDSGHNRIIVCDSSGNISAVIGSGATGHKDGDYAHATFHHPQGLSYHNEELYIADTENHLIRQVDMRAQKVTTIAGTGHQLLGRSAGGAALTTELSSPWDLIFIDDSLYIAMAGPHQLWVMNLKKGWIKPLVGSGREDIIDGPFKAAALAQPSGITTDGVRLYFADSEVSAIRSADLNPDGQVHTIIGAGLFEFGDKDGSSAIARLQHPLGVLFHNAKLYVADSYNHKIKIVDASARTSTGLAGTGKPGFEDGTQAQFSEPAGLTAIGNKLYVADTNNNAIRVIDLGTHETSTLKLSAHK